jgi:fatty acid desaturase
MKNTLIDPRELEPLAARSDRKGLARLAVHGAALLGGATLVWSTLDSWWLLPAMLLHGLAVVSLFAAAHESIHYTAFRTRWLNQAVAWLAGLPILLNSTYFRQFHYAHHRHCQDPQRDPEWSPPPPRTRREYLWRMSGLPYWWGRIRQSAALARGDFTGLDYIPKGAHAAVRRSVLGMLGIYAAVLGSALAAHSTAVLWYWIFPVLLAQPFLRFYLLAEHTGCSLDDDGLSNTRTTLAAWPVRLLMWNMPYHAEHHLFPQLPFHALPQAHQLVGARLGAVAPSYLDTHRTLWRLAGSFSSGLQRSP